MAVRAKSNYFLFTIPMVTLKSVSIFGVNPVFDGALLRTAAFHFALRLIRFFTISHTGSFHMNTHSCTYALSNSRRLPLPPDHGGTLFLSIAKKSPLHWLRVRLSVDAIRLHWPNFRLNEYFNSNGQSVNRRTVIHARLHLNVCVNYAQFPTPDDDAQWRLPAAEMRQYFPADDECAFRPRVVPERDGTFRLNLKNGTRSGVHSPPPRMCVDSISLARCR